jgi:hypothetical protein
MPHLSQIFIFPIKSLDGVSVDRATVLESGALQYDREYAIVDQQGKFVNGKRTATVHSVRSQFDLTAQTVTLHIEGNSETAQFHLVSDRAALETWLSDYFGFAVTLIRNPEVGFPDDTLSPGPTVISTATLAAVAAWFPGISLEAARYRFRTNLEITDTEAFWEDRLYGAADRTQPFQIGSVQLEGVNPCQRCIVPVRDVITGEAYPNFQKTFLTQRQATLPTWAERSRFNHFYRLAINTRLSPMQAGRSVCLGDAVQMCA